MAKKSESTLLLKIKSTGEEALEKAGSALAAIGQVGAAAFGILAGAAAGAIHAYKESEEVVNSLNQTLINNGIYTKSLSDEYQKMAAALQKKSTYSDEDIMKAQTQLQLYLGQTKITKELLQGTLDLAAAKKMDLTSAAEMVGKSIGTETNILARHGVYLTQGADQTQKFAQMTDLLGRKFGGQAQAATQGLGALDQMKIAMGDILEVAGQRLAPVVVQLAQYITKMSVAIQNNRQFVDGFVASIRFMSEIGVVAKNVIFGLAEVISQRLGAGFGAISQAMEGNFRQAWETIKTINEDSSSIVSARYQTLKDELNAIDASFSEQKDLEHEEELEKLRLTHESRAALDTEARLAKEAARREAYEKELADIEKSDVMKANKQLQFLNNAIKHEEDITRKKQLEIEKRNLLEDEYNKRHGINLSFRQQLEKTMEDDRFKRAEGGLNALAQLQTSKNNELKSIGKAAAIAQIGIDTARGAMAAYAGTFAALAWIPVVGPIIAGPAAYAAAGAVIAFGAEKAAGVAAMAEGGIVKATPGGIPAIIGEGGRDEAVIPLDEGGASMMGNKITIVVNGGLLGDQSEARAFAIAVDRELLKLRQSNESVAFDEGVI
jgi:hypothetical protein